MFSRQDLDEIDFQSIAREVKEFGEWNLYFMLLVNLMFFHVVFIFPDFISIIPFAHEVSEPDCNRHKLKWARPTCPKSFDPLSPDIHIQIFQTDLGTFP